MSRYRCHANLPCLLVAGAIVVLLGTWPAEAQPGPATASSEARTAAAAKEPTKNEDGRYVAEDGTPSYKIGADGTLDWYTFSGYRRYHAECHTCHGPEGEGSTYAPGLVKSLKTMSHEDFMQVVVNGKKSVNVAQQQVMPAFGENANVMCYLDDIYSYLKARSDGVLARGRPAKREDKPEAATKNENTCFGRS
jgi:methanol metabolism-related c-type cytochrome